MNPNLDQADNVFFFFIAVAGCACAVLSVAGPPMRAWRRAALAVIGALLMCWSFHMLVEARYFIEQLDEPAEPSRYPPAQGGER